MNEPAEVTVTVETPPAPAEPSPPPEESLASTVANLAEQVGALRVTVEAMTVRTDSIERLAADGSTELQSVSSRLGALSAQVTTLENDLTEELPPAESLPDASGAESVEIVELAPPADVPATPQKPRGMLHRAMFGFGRS